MGLVGQEDRGVPPGEFAQVGERGDRAVHRKERVGDDELAAGGGGRQELLERIEVAMRVDMDRGPREPAAVDQAGMVSLVGIDRVAGAGKGGDRGRVGREATDEDQGRLHAEEGGDRPLQVFVGLRVAAH